MASWMPSLPCHTQHEWSWATSSSSNARLLQSRMKISIPKLCLLMPWSLASLSASGGSFFRKRLKSHKDCSSNSAVWWQIFIRRQQAQHLLNAYFQHLAMSGQSYEIGWTHKRLINLLKFTAISVLLSPIGSRGLDRQDCLELIVLCKHCTCLVCYSLLDLKKIEIQCFTHCTLRMCLMVIYSSIAV